MHQYNTPTNGRMFVFVENRALLMLQLDLCRDEWVTEIVGFTLATGGRLCLQYVGG